MPTGLKNAVDDFGADRTGASDTTVDIQAALNGSTSKTLVIPPGTYRLDESLYIPGDHIEILAYGARFLRGPNGNQTLMLRSGMSSTGYGGPSNITIRGGIWDAHGGNNLNCDIFAFTHGENFTIEDVTFQNVPDWHAIELNGIRRARIRNCVFKDFRAVTASRVFSEAIQLQEAHDAYTTWDVVVEGCRTSGFGKFIGTHTTPPQAGSHQHIRIANNYIEDTMHYAIGFQSWRNVTITGNTMWNCNGGISGYLPSNGANNSWWHSQTENLVIANNVIDGSGRTNGNPTRVTSALEVVGANGDTTVENVVVAGNIVRDWDNAYGIRMNYIHEAVCTSNIVKYHGGTGTGIAVTNCSGATIADNNVRYAGTGTLLTTAGSSQVYANNNRLY